jgi:membrane associated rhomboid family serine protease
MLPLRDENPTRRFPVVTIALIAVNVAGFFYQVSLPEQLRADLVARRGLVPAFVTLIPRLGPEAVLPAASSFLTSMFLHGDLLHLLGNMLFLWIFGDNVEDRLGRMRFLVFYLLCGLAAAATQIAALPDSRVPMIGASGAISGVLGAYMLLFPAARVLTLIPIFVFLQFVRLPAILLLGLWFLYQILHSLMAAPGGGGVAWFAHIGGFVTGLLLIALFLPRRRTPPRAVRDPGWI